MTTKYSRVVKSSSLCQFLCSAQYPTVTLGYEKGKLKSAFVMILVRFNNLDSENYELIGLVSRRDFPVHAEVLFHSCSVDGEVWPTRK